MHFSSKLANKCCSLPLCVRHNRMAVIGKSVHCKTSDPVSLPVIRPSVQTGCCMVELTLATGNKTEQQTSNLVQQQSAYRPSSNPNQPVPRAHYASGVGLLDGILFSDLS
ncbi:unnamed protein product [Protopolystoma xenopodis]|uniref:Uncharacterized protein n=1 Tax=Protopolystoma xenopodis TaxID=117903 RepID=A0A448XHM0_9PLAT|nr:unnamed protein product [Protopolystoma xenopodis]